MGQQFYPSAKCFQCLQGVLVSQLLRLLVTDQNEVMLQHLAAFGNTIFLCRCSINNVKIDNKRLLNDKYCDRGFIGIVADVEGAVRRVCQSLQSPMSETKEAVSKK